MSDLHNSQKQIDACLRNVRENPEIPEKHKQLLEDLNNELVIQDLSDARRFRYLNNVKRIMEYNSDKDLDLTDLDESSVRKVLMQIEQSRYYSKEYSEKTKDGYRGAVKKLLKLQDKDPDELVGEDFTWYRAKLMENPTDPEDLPTPSDVKILSRQLEARSKTLTGKRNVAFLLALWDTGARVGEILNVKTSDVTVKQNTVVLKVPGNKESPDRKVPCFVAAPALKRWLESHPSNGDEEEFLFCRVNDVSNLKNQEGVKPNPQVRMHYRTTVKILNDAFQERLDDLNCDLEGQHNHIFRKARISYLKRADVMNESMIDKRVGHVVGSEHTRVYTRITDQEAGNAYLEGMGIEEEADNSVEKDLYPLDCINCGAINSGHRKSCRECGISLDTHAYPRSVDVEDGGQEMMKQKKKAEFFRKLLTSNTSAEEAELEKLAEETIEEEPVMKS